MTEQDSEDARDPRYEVDEDGNLVPHSPDDQDFDLTFDED